jgi:hypothetical protein
MQKVEDDMHTVYVLLTLAAGFGLGRIHNIAKVKAELAALEAKATADGKAVIAAIRSKL